MHGTITCLKIRWSSKPFRANNLFRFDQNTVSIQHVDTIYIGWVWSNKNRHIKHYGCQFQTENNKTNNVLTSKETTIKVIFSPSNYIYKHFNITFINTHHQWTCPILKNKCSKEMPNGRIKYLPIRGKNVGLIQGSSKSNLWWYW